MQTIGYQEAAGAAPEHGEKTKKDFVEKILGRENVIGHARSLEIYHPFIAERMGHTSGRREICATLTHNLPTQERIAQMYKEEFGTGVPREAQEAFVQSIETQYGVMLATLGEMMLFQEDPAATNLCVINTDKIRSLHELKGMLEKALHLLTYSYFAPKVEACNQNKRHIIDEVEVISDLDRGFRLVTMLRKFGVRTPAVNDLIIGLRAVYHAWHADPMRKQSGANQFDERSSASRLLHELNEHVSS